jgi:hypothetical protein
MNTNKVWVVEQGEYDTVVTGVYRSLDAAVTAIKDDGIASKIDEWAELEDCGDGSYLLVGMLGAYGRSIWVITPWEIKP